MLNTHRSFFLLFDHLCCFLKHYLQMLNTAWAYKPLIATNRSSFILDIYLLSSWAGTNETHLVWLPVRLSWAAIHIYADSGKLTQFVTSPQKMGQEISNCLYFANTVMKIDKIWRTIGISILFWYWTHFSWP